MKQQELAPTTPDQPAVTPGEASLEAPLLPEVAQVQRGEATNEPILTGVENSEPTHGIAPADAEQPGWLRRNLSKISMAAFLGGTTVALALNPLGGLEHDVVQAAPWTLLGAGATESMWIGGAALMAGSAGKKIGNPLTLKSRWGEITQNIVDSRGFRTGLAINTIGALGTAAVVETAAITSLPPETWLGATGLAGADVAMTVGVRSGLYASIKESDKAPEKSAKPEVKVRKAIATDIDRLADIDLLLFDKAYGTDKPAKEDIVATLTQRFANNPDWMFVSEVNGVVEGFVSAFRTDVPAEDFQSWEHSTANGTLEGRVNPKGKYTYVTNMTIKHEAVELGAEEMLLANLFANSIRVGVEYGYFVARMPHFKRWVAEQEVAVTDENKQELAEQYMNLRREDGKRSDPQLRMYENFGYKLQRMVPDAFKDDASLDTGVIFKAAIPPANNVLKRVRPVRAVMAMALRRIAKNPKLLKKVF